MITEQEIEKIEKYLDGSLSEIEIIEIKSRIQNDKEFANEVEFIKNLKFAAFQEGRKELRYRVKTIIDTSNVPKQSIIKEFIKNFLNLRDQIAQYFDQSRMRLAYVLTIILLLIFIPVLIVLIEHRKTIKENEYAVQKIDSSYIIKRDLRSIFLSKKPIMPEVQIKTEIIKDNQFGYSGEAQISPSQITIRIYDNNKFIYHYFVESDTIFLLGQFNKEYINEVYQFPQFLLIEYSKVFFRISKVEGELRNIEIEKDSSILKKCLIK